MSFLSDMFSSLLAPFKAAVDNLNAAKKEKNLGKTITALGGVVEVAAKATEDTAQSLKAAGTVISGPQKHNIVKNTVGALATKGINKAVDIPGLDEQTEEVFFGTLINGFLDFIIERSVSKLNKNGWKLGQ